jgi:preprotein translocase subunit SecE
MNPKELVEKLIAKVRGWADRVKQFYQDVRSEMKKVSWPARQEVLGTTVVVIVSVFFFGIYLFAVDFVLQSGLNWVLKYFNSGG